MDFLEAETAKYEDISDRYLRIRELYEKKLWYQLSSALEAFARDPACSKGRNLIDLFNEFVSKIKGRVNPVLYVRIAALSARQYYPSRPFKNSEIDEAISFLEKASSDRKELGAEAWWIGRMEVVSLKLKKGEYSAVKSQLEIAKSAMTGYEGMDPAVPATYYRVASEYYKTVGPAAQYYHHALLYVGHVRSTDLTSSEKEALAVDIALAAIVGDGVFNFGEVLAQEIVQTLKSTSKAWLLDVLFCLHRGDIEGFSKIVSAHRSEFDAQPALVKNEEAIRKKLTLLALTELVIRRPSTERVVSFQDIASVTKLPVDKVEWVLMRAMSLGLLEGEIDEVEQKVEITFIKPRVLDSQQIESLKDKVALWHEKVKSMQHYVEDHTDELFM